MGRSYRGEGKRDRYISMAEGRASARSVEAAPSVSTAEGRPATCRQCRAAKAGGCGSARTSSAASTRRSLRYRQRCGAHEPSGRGASHQAPPADGGHSGAGGRAARGFSRPRRRCRAAAWRGARGSGSEQLAREADGGDAGAAGRVRRGARRRRPAAAAAAGAGAAAAALVQW
jgi:hypothetical protein